MSDLSQANRPIMSAARPTPTAIRLVSMPNYSTKEARAAARCATWSASLTADRQIGS